MAKKRYYGGDIRMNNDTSAMANLPQQVVIKKYPPSTGYLPENLNDGMSGIDSQVSLDNAKKSSNLEPKKV